ncbi:MAG TPA: thiamine biosynthesis protein ThiF, partial [Thermopolyspora sp.]
GRTASHPGDGARPPDLVVLAPVTPLDGVLAGELAERGVPHLLTAAFEGRGSVGPLVLPGRTCCLRCLDLTRRDRDPAWPAISRQLGGFPVGEVACGTILSAVIAAHAAGHALAFVDGHETALANGTLDVSPDWHWRRRSWKPHPQCSCMRKESLSPTMVA